jgi:hypothetical protein
MALTARPSEYFTRAYGAELEDLSVGTDPTALPAHHYAGPQTRLDRFEFCPALVAWIQAGARRKKQGAR